VVSGNERKESMDRQRIRNGSACVLSVLLTLAFMIAALPKLLGAHVWVVKFINWGYPNWFPFAIGSLELLGGALLLIPRLARYGAIVLGVIMVGAAYTHLANGEGLQVLRPVIVLMLLGTVVWLRKPNRDNPRGAA
jgi:putative oxidoreductase